MIRIVLIDDHFLVRSGFKQMIQAESTVQVVGEAGTGSEGIELVNTVNPDVVVLDIKAT